MVDNIIVGAIGAGLASSTFRETSRESTFIGFICSLDTVIPNLELLKTLPNEIEEQLFKNSKLSTALNILRKAKLRILTLHEAK